MPVTIKTPSEIEKMRVAGRLAAEVLEMVAEYVRPGVTTEELDRICHEHIVRRQQAIPANLGYKGFPKTVCTSVNHVICHGIPSPSKVLKDGDIVNIDVTVIRDGFHGDTSRMYLVGKPDVRAQRLCSVAFESMMRGIEQVRPGATLGDIGHAIQKHVEANGFSVVREYCGHGIGEVYHRFRSGALESDDEVALVYDPESGCALSEPLVNMRATLEAAVQARTVSAEDAESVLRAARSLYFPERTWSGVLRTVPLGEEQRARLAAFVRTSAVDLKRADALAALEYIRAHFT